jgi:glutathione S-transferase
MWQMGGLGPMLGQVHHFVKYNKGKSDYGEMRYSNEGKRLYRVLNERLRTVTLSPVKAMASTQSLTLPAGHGYHGLSGRKLI